MKGLGNNDAFSRYQELCSKQSALEEKLSNGNLSEEKEKKIRFDLRNLKKGTERARKRIAGH